MKHLCIGDPFCKPETRQVAVVVVAITTTILQI